MVNGDWMDWCVRLGEAKGMLEDSGKKRENVARRNTVSPLRAALYCGGALYQKLRYHIRPRFGKILNHSHTENLETC